MHGVGSGTNRAGMHVEEVCTIDCNTARNIGADV